MVVHDVRARHEDGRFSNGGKLGERRGAAPAEDDIRRRHEKGHIINIVHHVKSGFLPAGEAEFVAHILRHALYAALARGMDEPERALLAVHGKSDHACDGLVHLRCAKTAPHGNDKRFVLRDAERAARGALIRTHEAKAHGRSGHDNLFGVLIVLPCLGKADHDLIHALFELARRETGRGIALMHDGGDAELCRLMQHRVADIPAGTDNDVRLKLLDNLPARGAGL